MTTTIHAPATSCPTPSPTQTPSSKAASSKASATPRPLFDHQVPAVADAVAGLANTARGQVIMACGTGKTVVAQRVAETLARTSTDTVLVLFPNLGLLAQNARAWATYREVGFTALALCSEQQVGRGKARDSDEIQLDPAEFGIPNTTDPEVLADWLASTPGRRVVFATYQSSNKLTAMHTAHPELSGWSMIVCDEAHRTSGPSAGLFSTVLDDTRVPAQRRLFLTATPRLHRLTRGKAAEDVVSMDDDALFGPRLHELSFAAAAEKGVLARYRLVVIGVDDATIDTLIRSNTRLTGLHDLDAKKAATLVAVNRAAKQHGLHRILAYHNAIEHSRDFAAHLALVESALPGTHKPTGPLGVRHVDGSMAPAVREAALTALTDTDDTNGAWTVVSNVKCLTEGIDVPTLDGIVVCEPRSSAVDVVQMVGRAIRPNTARDEPSVILLPVYLAPGEDPAQVVARSDFSEVVQTMTAMRDMDQTLDTTSPPQPSRGRSPTRRSPPTPAGSVVRPPGQSCRGKCHRRTRTASAHGATNHQGDRTTRIHRDRHHRRRLDRAETSQPDRAPADRLRHARGCRAGHGRPPRRSHPPARHRSTHQRVRDGGGSPSVLHRPGGARQRAPEVRDRRWIQARGLGERPPGGSDDRTTLSEEDRRAERTRDGVGHSRCRLPDRGGSPSDLHRPGGAR